MTKALPDLKVTLIILSVLIRKKKAEIINEKDYFIFLINTFRFLNNKD